MKSIYLPKTKRSLKNTSSSGFVLLFTVVLTVVILSISLGVSNITFRELTFATSARATNEAFFAADVGVECALYYDFRPVQTPEGPMFAFGADVEEVYTPCAGTALNLSNGEGTPSEPWIFVVPNLGETGQSCAIVSVSKDLSNPSFPETHIISQGYDLGGETTNCASSSPKRVERVIEVNY